jgi:hypothetical protein
MDPLSALSLACNILQMGDSAVKFGKRLKNLYQSAYGLAASHEQVKEGLEILDSILDEVQRIHNIAAQWPRSTEPSDVSLERVLKRCRQLAEDLTLLIESVRATRRKSILQSGKAALKSMLKQAQVDELEEELDRWHKLLMDLIVTRTK